MPAVQKALLSETARRLHVVLRMLLGAREWEAVVEQEDGWNCPRVVMLVAAPLLHALPPA